jgi:hypothetical protein
MEGNSKLTFSGRFKVEAFRNGKRLWIEKFDNIVVNEGIQYAMDNGIVDATWYVGLLGNVSPAASTTLSGVTGTEVTAYSGNRPAWTKVRTNQTLSNTASTADFTINADSTVIYGAFVATANTGSVGTLLAAKQFTGGSKSLDTNDQIKITYEITGSSS